MKLSLFSRLGLAMFASLLLGLGMTGCGGGTIAFLWVVGQQYNQISGFKVDDFTGNLTQIPHQPFTSGGTNPVMMVVKAGGRYVYVLNQGVGATPPTLVNGKYVAGTQATGGNIALFSVGGDGTLTLQQTYQSQGTNSQWMQMDASGTYLYVLDQYSPVSPLDGLYHGNGSVTVFSTDSATGRLTLVTSTTTCKGGLCPTYFEVGSSQAAFSAPFQMKTAGSCLYVANRNAVVPFVISGGQLQNSTTSPIFAVPTASHISSITGNGSAINLTDDTGDQIFRYTVGSSCGLASTGGGVVSLAQYGLVNPVWTLFDNSGKYLYVLQGTNPKSTPGSSNSLIGAFNITQNTQTQFIANYGTGSGPVCSVEDQSSQYIYTSNYNDGTISGNQIDTTTGFLSPLTRGSTFQATGQLECLAISNSID